MDENLDEELMSAVERISTALDKAHDGWRSYLQFIRGVTAVLEFSGAVPDEALKQWQLPLISTFQRVAYADADAGGVPDIANWCLKQAVTLLQIYPEEVDLLTLIGRNWLSRAQRSLAKIRLSGQSSTSSGGSLLSSFSTGEEARQASNATIEAESRLHTSDYVEARGILLSAVEYLELSMEAAPTQGMMTGDLLSTAAEAYMSLGNVSSPRTCRRYFQRALVCLRAANELPNYVLPARLQKSYLEEFGSLMEGLN